VAQQLAQTAKTYSRALILWGEGLALKANTCTDALEAQTKG